MKIPALRRLNCFPLTLSQIATTKAYAKGLPAQSMIALIEILSLVLHTNAQANPQ